LACDFDLARVIWNEHSVFNDQFQIERKSGLEGGVDLVNLLKQVEERDIAGCPGALIESELGLGFSAFGPSSGPASF
jgi:hypothetical protein